jgi:hypothetical protein
MFSNKLLGLTLALFWTPALAAGWLPLAAGSGSGCTQATTFLARTSGLSGTESAAYTNLICTMVSDGSFALLDGLYIFATNSTTTANLNLISTSYALTTNGAVSFSADQGYTGDGSTGYLATGFTPSTAGGQFVQNSANLGIYILTSRTTSQGYVDIGAGGGSVYSLIQPLFNGGGGQAWLVNSLSLNTYVPTNVQGSWLASRTSSALTTYYGNGVSVGSNASDAAAGNANQQIIILALEDGGFVDSFSTDQLSAAWYGAGLSSTQEATVQTDINNYMKALGINVY